MDASRSLYLPDFMTGLLVGLALNKVHSLSLRQNRLDRAFNRLNDAILSEAEKENLAVKFRFRFHPIQPPRPRAQPLAALPPRLRPPAAHPLTLSPSPATRTRELPTTRPRGRRPRPQLADRGRLFWPLSRWPGRARRPCPTRNSFVGKGLQTRPSVASPAVAPGPTRPPDRPHADHDIRRCQSLTSVTWPRPDPLAALGHFLAALGHFWPRATPHRAAKLRRRRLTVPGQRTDNRWPCLPWDTCCPPASRRIGAATAAKLRRNYGGRTPQQRPDLDTSSLRSENTTCGDGRSGVARAGATPRAGPAARPAPAGLFRVPDYRASSRGGRGWSPVGHGAAGPGGAVPRGDRLPGRGATAAGRGRCHGVAAVRAPVRGVHGRVGAAAAGGLEIDSEDLLRALRGQYSATWAT
jgi:hypothetical protein